MLANIAQIPLPRPNLHSVVSRVIRTTESVIPFRFKQKALEKGLNKAFHQPLEDDEFWFLENQYLGVEVTDLGIKVVISCNAERLIVCQQDNADAWIKGKAEDLIKLANRELDPDTLFFQRRLLIEGNTELGLAVKNLLDSIDWDDLPDSVRKGLAMVQKLPI
ncbi:ubiquinone anaerobic biosynthesis accessory factor UbiT [Amphritea balenae]|uniref:Ubiquinone biosynthesis accessory factor UbiT n=1 Tax=Amphritea balenae TaxID=452629 RepID=A0A3P1SWY2_9GAMM|nr:SCP2 sterol-binding domain-containing protein [Amphritea balenae]RRD01634.1 SCP2 domain-containing protein [Amphritea balenae]GGK55415.1 SCP2 domain-containing protein [Amphritea balenae]